MFTVHLIVLILHLRINAFIRFYTPITLFNNQINYEIPPNFTLK